MGEMTEGPLFVNEGDITLSGSSRIGEPSEPIEVFCDGNVPDTSRIHGTISSDCPKIELPPMGDSELISAANNRRIAKLSKARIPVELEAQLTAVEHDDDLTMEVGVEWTTVQCRELLERGVPGIHFYTMNKSPATRHVFRNLQR